ncbi:MarR family winged helix-turn-helix transcriptional regulator [Lactiplantibacillus modestisalitolerans]|uniref:MarR family winged helix-turn-helix transcriptional regulator n=1 Tax=Lactiplantibacillus modestisalitolerans TaxID=1457219 RepID=A0ABV5WU28_9LACO|nr:MarR family winged helix-turn-helix transcriptional regulator [Lactiplantibacillus modestisalitolerans]
MQESLDHIIDIMQLERYLKQLTTDWAADTGLTLNDLRILVYIQKHPASEIAVVATALHVVKVSLVQNIGSLTKQGLIVSAPSATDRRVHLLSLTSKGHERMAEIDQQLSRSLSHESAQRLIKSLPSLAGLLRDAD